MLELMGCFILFLKKNHIEKKTILLGIYQIIFDILNSLFRIKYWPWLLGMIFKDMELYKQPISVVNNKYHYQCMSQVSSNSQDTTSRKFNMKDLRLYNTYQRLGILIYTYVAILFLSSVKKVGLRV